MTGVMVFILTGLSVKLAPVLKVKNLFALMYIICSIKKRTPNYLICGEFQIMTNLKNKQFSLVLHSILSI